MSHYLNRKSRLSNTECKFKVTFVNNAKNAVLALLMMFSMYKARLKLKIFMIFITRKSNKLCFA